MVTMASPKGDFRLLDQRGVVSLEVVGQRWCLLNNLTCERVWLPDFPAGVSVDIGYEDGEAFVFADHGEPQPKLASEFLTWSVYTDDAGVLLLVNNEGGEQELLQTKLQRFDFAEARIIFGEVRKEVNIQVAVFQVPFNGGAIIWDLGGIFKHLGLNTGRSDANPGKWIADTWHVWESFMQTMSLQGSLVKSQPYSNRSGGNDSPVDGRRVLTWPGASSSCLVALLLRWASCQASKGGLKQLRQRASCGAFLNSLVDFVCNERFKLQLFLDDEVRMAWPALPVGTCFYEAQVQRGGVLNLAPLKQRCEQLHRKKWVKLLEGLADDEATILDLAMEAMRSTRQCSLARQLVWAIGNRLDLFLREMVDGARVGAGDVQAYKATFDTTSDCAMERQLTLYCMGVQAATMGSKPMRLSCAPDKSRVHSMGMMNTAFVLPNGTGFWGVPQAGCAFVV